MCVFMERTIWFDIIMIYPEKQNELHVLMIIIPPLNEVERGVYWNEIVRLSVCPSVDTTPLTLSRVQFFSNCGQT